MPSEGLQINGKLSMGTLKKDKSFKGKKGCKRERG
jgi:hypothetical protein